MINNREMALETLLVEQTLAMARTLVAGAEPVKAYDLCTINAPAMALEHPAVREFAETLKEQIDQAFSDEAYVERYGNRTFKELYALGSEPKPFADIGLLTLDRAKRTLGLMAEMQPERVLSVGAGDCTLEKLLLETHPSMHLDVSELNDTAGEAVTALQGLFPGRVRSVGRFDVGDVSARTEQYDVVMCLEVVEHVADDVLFLYNLGLALGKDGVLILSTPNCVDWIERIHLDRFGPANWYQHLRAYTPRSLNEAFLDAGLCATIRTTTQGALYVTATRERGVGAAQAESVEVRLSAPSQEAVTRLQALPKGSVVYTNMLLTEGEAVIAALRGVVIYPMRLAPKGCPEMV